MFEQLSTLTAETEAAIAGANSLQELEELEVRVLGRKGSLTQLLRGLGSLPPEERPKAGQQVNQVKEQLQALLETRRSGLAGDEARRRLEAERLDVSLPGRTFQAGRQNVLSQTFDRVRQTFLAQGFEFVESPDLEETRYNFDALNYPPNHPAMEEEMTFFVSDTRLLRTQTTCVQGRIFEEVAAGHRKLPLKIATIGRCYRYEAVDATHGHTFYQVDCFAVDHGIGMHHLKGTLTAYVHRMFGPEIRIRYRPDFFPFVEPGLEIAIERGESWLELGGAGLIHPNILRRYGIDPEEWSGFAFGMGIERVPMRQYGIDDLRLFYENDLRFLEQF
ncbi:MAG TPA: phenylalanine--tRNA ligase subunit alpha [Armatimonadota bacterium]|jgi:phenylalanyl-tRNA synthetase alpha chain